MLRIRRTELTMTAKANGVFRRLVLLRQARPSRSCCPSSRVCLTCPERIGHARGIIHLLPVANRREHHQAAAPFMVRDVTGWRSSKPTSTRAGKERGGQAARLR